MAIAFYRVQKFRYY